MMFIPLLIVSGSFAQEKKQNLDTLYYKARHLAAEKKYNESRKLSSEILKHAPEYHDVRILIGRTYTWEKQYDSARTEIKKVLKKEPLHEDALRAIIDIELWTKHYKESLTYCDTALNTYKNDTSILYKKALSHEHLCQLNKAINTTDTLIIVDTTNIRAKEYREHLLHERRKQYPINIEHTFDYFRIPYVRRWHVTSISFFSLNKCRNTIVGRINLGQMVNNERPFGTNISKQYEIDYFPKFGSRDYMYLNFGYSPDKFFPRYRAGLEYFHLFGEKIEASAGVRYLAYYNEWDDLIDAVFYTGSLSWYLATYWFTLRPFIVVEDGEVSQAWFFSARRYIDTDKNFITATFGFGNSPDIPDNNIADFSIYNLRSWNVRIDGQYEISDYILLKASLAYKYEEYATDLYRNHYTITAGVMFYLK